VSSRVQVKGEGGERARKREVRGKERGRGEGKKEPRAEVHHEEEE
jgi:hypothetical protein